MVLAYLSMDNVTLSTPAVYISSSLCGSSVVVESQLISAAAEDVIDPSPPPPPTLPPRLPRRTTTTSPETSDVASCSTSVPCGVHHHHHHHHQLRPCPPVPPAPPLPAREPLHCVGVVPSAPGAASTTVAAAARRVPSSCGRPSSSPPPMLSTSAPPLDQIVPLDRWPLSSSHHNSRPQHVASSIANADKVSSALFGGAADTHHRLSPQLPPPSSSSQPPPTLRQPVGQQPALAPVTSELVIIMPAVSSQSQSGGNLYVEAPTLRRSPVPVTSAGVRAHSSSPVRSAAPQLSSNATLHVPMMTAPGLDGSNHHPSLLAHQHHHPRRTTTTPTIPVVTAQPQSTVKAPGSDGIDGKTKRAMASSSPNCRGTVLCPRCNRCPCEQCRSHRELPRRWFGDCECSAQRCVKVTSCMCCIEAIFYHCLDGGDEVMDDAGAVDDPCACCERPRCCLRWTVMTALGLTVLPCLCLYCPLQCGVGALTSCYNACLEHERGCRCQSAAEHSGATTSSSQEASSGGSTRGLLAESENSST